MPNHVQNILFVEGSAQDTAAFFDLCKVSDTDHFSFAGIVPRPSDAQLGREMVMGIGYALPAFGLAHPMSWEITHWGSKWDAYEVGAVWVHDTYKRISFQTAWTPPEPWLKAASTRFPTLVFRMMSKDEGALRGCVFVARGGDVAMDDGLGDSDDDNGDGGGDGDDDEVEDDSRGDITLHFDAAKPHKYLRYMKCYNFVDGPLPGERA